MANERLLDTNIASAFLGGNDRVRRRFSTRMPDTLPFICAAELLYGAENSSDPAVALRPIQEFLGLFDVVFPSSDTLPVYAKLRSHLNRAGREIPMNDLWLASLAVAREAVLVTHDGHFKDIPGLELEDWLEE